MDTYEKKYKEALERAKLSRLQLLDIGEEATEIEYIFPELAESEDERIRKALKEGFKYHQLFNPTFGGIPCIEIVNWLEKQNHDGKKWIYEDVYLKEKEQLIQDGIEEVLENPQKYGLEKQCEQKSADKVEPKFKVGDWILYSGDHYDGVRHITKIDEKGYYIERNGFPHGIIPFNHEIFMRLWTIQYAKDGDVLAVDSMPFIYNGAKNEVTVGAYCGFNAKHKFSFAYNYVINQNITPATREQRDALMKAITDAGYEWDSEKKELNKIETPEESLCISTEEYNKVVNECVFGAENKSRWTEEDEKNFLGVIDEIKANKSNAPDYDLETYDRFLSWLESIKHRIS